MKKKAKEEKEKSTQLAKTKENLPSILKDIGVSEKLVTRFSNPNTNLTVHEIAECVDLIQTHAKEHRENLEVRFLLRFTK